MDQQKKKSKKVLTILFSLLGVLLVGLIGAIVYFYLLGDIFQPEQETTITCGCYYIDPQVTSTCGDTKRAFKFNTSTGSVSECSATCPLTDLSTNMLYSTTPQDSYLTCTTKNITSTACNSMEIKTTDGLTVTGKIQPDEEIIITATFDSDQYTNPQFLINNVPTEPDEIDGNTINKTVSDFGENSTLLISAQAVNSKGDTVSSIICNRLIDITTTARAGVSEISFDTYSSVGKTKLRSALITAGGLQDTDTTLKFTLDNTTLNMTEGFDLDPSRGRITITETQLYSSSNFTENSSFSVLDDKDGTVNITVEVIQQSSSLGTASVEVEFEQTEVDDIGKDGEDTDTDTDTTDDDTDTTTDEQDGTYSQFTVNKSSSETCMERVSPDNTTTFTITVTNSGENTDTIESVKDKLPLGFEYVDGSSTLNGNAIADSVFVTKSVIGNTEEIVWEPQSTWSINSSSSLVITFEAVAGTQALTGDNLNEVIVTPTELPEDPSTLRASVEVVVAQDCTNADSIPQTGIFDTTLGRIFVGIAIILVGIIIYNTNKGTQLATNIVNSNTYRSAEMTSYKIFNPKKYFEEKILERTQRKR